MPDPDRYMTSQVPNLRRNLFRALPSMAEHKCHNDHGVSFRKECQHTEIPHLFEHLVLELQSQAQAAELLQGETEWDWRVDPRGFFTVSVDYENELLVVGAIKLAERMIVALDTRGMTLMNVPMEIERLRQLAQLGREMEPLTFTFSAGDRVGSSSAADIIPRTRNRRRIPRRTWDSIPMRPAAPVESEVELVVA